MTRGKPTTSIGTADLQTLANKLKSIDSNKSGAIQVEADMQLKIIKQVQGITEGSGGQTWNRYSIYECSDGKVNQNITFFGYADLQSGQTIQSKVICNYYKDKIAFKIRDNGYSIINLSPQEAEKKIREITEAQLKNKQEEELKKKQEEELKKKQEEQLKKKQLEEEKRKHQEEQIKIDELKISQAIIIEKLSDKIDKEIQKPQIQIFKPNPDNKTGLFGIFKEEQKNFKLPIAKNICDNFEFVDFNYKIKIKNEEYEIIGQRHPYFYDLKSTYVRTYLFESYENKIVDAEIEYLLKGRKSNIRTSLVKFWSGKQFFLLESQFDLLLGRFEYKDLKLTEIPLDEIILIEKAKKKSTFTKIELDALISEIQKVLTEETKDKKEKIDKIFEFYSNKFDISDITINQMKSTAYSKL